MLPVILVCCQFSIADQMNIVDTKDEDLAYNRGDKEDCDEDSEQNFGQSTSNTTLRRSAAYSITFISKTFPTETL